MSEIPATYQVVKKLPDSEIVAKIAIKFIPKGITCEIPYILNSDSFKATINEKGLGINHLGNGFFLHWDYFINIIRLLNENGALNIDEILSSIETGEGFDIFNKPAGNLYYDLAKVSSSWISTIASILIWANICKIENNILKLS